MSRSGGDAGLLARAGIDQGWPAGLRPALPATLRPAGQPLWRRIGARLAGQRRQVRPLRIRRRRACRRHSGQELGSRPGPCQRLAGRAGAGLSGLEGLKGSLDPDHPQPRLSGAVPAGLAAPDRGARKFLPHRRARILRPRLVPQGRPRLRLASDHRQRHLCEGDHDARTRLRARRPAAAPLECRATDRHFERHRRKLGSPRLRATGADLQSPATGRASRRMPITSASSSAWRCRAVRCSGWLPAWFTRRASISCCPRPTKSSRPADRSW